MSKHELTVRLLVVAALGAALALGGCEALLGDDADAGTGDDGGGGGGGPFATLYGGYIQECLHCHTPDGLGRTSDTEQTLDFTSQTTAHRTLTTGRASGLKGNQEGCNGVPFVAASPGDSLVLAVLDEGVRQAFDVAAHSGCDTNAISDMTVKVGDAPSSGFVDQLEAWISGGAPAE